MEVRQNWARNLLLFSGFWFLYRSYYIYLRLTWNSRAPAAAS